MGSVKELTVIKPASEEAPGVGEFFFSDRYSAFDWGEMPDHIANKGASLCMMAAWNFEQLEAIGVKTHYLGLVDGEGNTVKTNDLVRQGKHSNKMRFKLVRVLPSDDDYAAYSKQNNNFLIPLEIVYRNGLPQGSSVFKKIEKAKKEGNLDKILKSIGLDHEPVEGEMLPKPVYDFWTKLESTDRLLSNEEAKRISGIGNRFDELTEIADKTNTLLTRQAEHRGMVHYDGKIECIYSHGEIMIGDTVGTLDENRFAFQGLQISKQILRNAYLGTQWYKDLENVKKTLGKDDDIQAKCPSKPERLPKHFIKLVSEVYQSACNQYAGQRMFNTPELSELVRLLAEYKL